MADLPALGALSCDPRRHVAPEVWGHRVPIYLMVEPSILESRGLCSGVQIDQLGGGGGAGSRGMWLRAGTCRGRRRCRCGTGAPAAGSEEKSSEQREGLHQL